MADDKRSQPTLANDHMTVAHLQGALEPSQPSSPVDAFKHMTTAHVAEALVPNAPPPAAASEGTAPIAPSTQPKDK
jgi:hypothetical protein